MKLNQRSPDHQQCCGQSRAECACPPRKTYVTRRWTREDRLTLIRGLVALYQRLGYPPPHREVAAHFGRAWTTLAIRFCGRSAGWSWPSNGFRRWSRLAGVPVVLHPAGWNKGRTDKPRQAGYVRRDVEQAALLDAEIQRDRAAIALEAAGLRRPPPLCSPETPTRRRD